MDIAYNNREPSLVSSLILIKEKLFINEYFVRMCGQFAVAKLLETAIVNLSRIDVIWKQITSHFLEGFPIISNIFLQF